MQQDKYALVRSIFNERNFKIPLVVPKLVDNAFRAVEDRFDMIEALIYE